MRNTSAIRRVDDLGRVVIPKEIRESLRLITGSAVLVSCDEHNQIIITKYSKIKNIMDFAKMCLDSFSGFQDLTVYLCDLDKILAMNNEGKKHILDTPISKQLYTSLEGREIQVRQNENMIHIHDTEDCKMGFCSQAIFPIICNGDVCGGLILITKKLTENFDFAKPIHRFMCDYLSD